jgi:AFG3 family protein
VFALLAAGGVVAKVAYDYLSSAEHMTYNDFVVNYFERDLVKAIQIHRLVDGSHYRTYAVVQMTNGDERVLNLGNVDHFLENLERLQTQKGKDARSLIPVDFHYSSDANKVFDRVVNLVYLGATLGIMFALFKSLRSTLSQVNKGNDVFGMGKSNVKVFGVDTQVKVRFKDVAGLDEAKNEITEFVDFLKKPKKYKDIGAKLPKGALLAGPPGTGKTMLAKACAGEAGVPFFYISGSDFVEMFVGVGASRVRDLFKQAKAKSPSIIFIDEIDAVGRKRESRIGGNDERDNTLNQLLVEMDGFGTDQSVIVLAATNRKELLDPALTRPGRFDRTVDITLPDLEGRKHIFLVHLAGLKLDPSRTTDDYAKRLATLTPGFSGAEIANLCNEAAIMAARLNKKAIDSHDFEMASERVLAGLEKKKIVSEEERRIVAVHESGHAVVSWFLEGGHPLLKLTIIPRSKGSLGFAQYLPNESSLETKQELIDKLCSILGGRCAEEVFFGRITTGAYDDLKKAYEMAYAMVTKYGMSEKIGYIGYVESDYNKTYSDQTNK